MKGGYQHPERMTPKEITKRWEELEFEVRRDRWDMASVMRVAINGDQKNFSGFEELYLKPRDDGQPAAGSKPKGTFHDDSLKDAIRKHVMEARADPVEGVDLETLVSHLTGAPRDESQVKP